MAKFLFCLPRFHTNAVPWVRILKNAGHSAVIHVVTEGASESTKDIEVLRLPPGRLSAFFKRRLKESGQNDPYAAPGFSNYWSILSRENPDVVLIRGVTRWFSRTALIVCLLQRRKVVIYDQEDPVPSALSTWIRRAALRVIGISHVTARLPQKPPPKSFAKAQSLPFGAPEDWKSSSGRRKWVGAPKILMVAKYRNRKGHHALLLALAKLASEYKFSLTFCGEEVSSEDTLFVKSISEHAKLLGLSNRVSFQNNLPHSDMGALYRAHDLFILPSLNEPAGVSPCEAAWHGCAVLVSRDTGTRGYFPPGPDFEFDPEDVNDIARSLRTPLQNREALESLRNRCHSHILDVADDKSVLCIFERLQ
ncbi:glycosyltransferase family 4 protein [Qipengyuania nanhaisediminis]|uniref:Glycosyltransferase involved in cell wall bisynthesis n=1 Tax=Qipengyuania nanhaisediminis TaxID=604088 RepID=A0A1I5QBW6_9SPHN|nr:glycosyltransferase family 4 protein [Qipengyuania nanhaisediminis]SFP43733.1 Glycosyltransferase involved in cell wall bisynthesis [Qipengyuania nanhaisediminis]